MALHGALWQAPSPIDDAIADMSPAHRVLHMYSGTVQLPRGAWRHCGNIAGEPGTVYSLQL